MSRIAESVLKRTESVCPRCLTRIPAVLSKIGDEVLMIKSCADHGEFRTVVWRGEPAFSDWTRPKTPIRAKVCYTEVRNGCPFDCGLCADHRQLGCTGLMEVTSRCNLHCAVCFADSDSLKGSDPSLSEIEEWYRRIMEVSGPCSIQLSGGEPTLRDDLPEIIALGKKIGFSFIQLNTNGIRLAVEEDYARSLREAGLVSVFLQYDGTKDDIYVKLRGRPLLALKHQAIERCIAGGIGVVLVPTLVPGINTDNLGAIVRTALDMGSGVRGVHFQPIAHFGRCSLNDEQDSRITLPEVMTALEQQTNGMVRKTDFSPPGCEHELCSFHGSFVRKPGGSLKVVRQRQPGSCCGPAANSEGGALRTVSLVAGQWAAPSVKKPSAAEGTAMETGSPCACSQEAIIDGCPVLGLDEFLEQMRRNSFTITGMAFQDAWNLDLDRLRNCCIHVVAPDGRLIPFCAYNLTASSGAGLYRIR
jgi:uncharacterized radical SAM superfamily Fe-S cluster-containing enzyme